jgi:hypothetical protein
MGNILLISISNPVPGRLIPLFARITGGPVKNRPSAPAHTVPKTYKSPRDRNRDRKGSIVPGW